MYLPATGLQLVQVGTGVVLQPIPAGPAAPTAMETLMIMEQQTALTAPPAPTGMVTAGANTMITGGTARITGPGGTDVPGTVTPMAGGMTATIMFPESNTGAPEARL